MDLTLITTGTESSTAETYTEDTFLIEVKTYMTYKVAKYINKYWLPILIPFGLVGNTLTFLVMMRPNNRNISTCIYMAAISMNDNAMMFIEIHAWFVSAFDIHGWYLWECKIAAYLVFSSLQCATYLILAMTVDKYIAIKWPHKAATYSTPSRAKIIILTIVTFVALYNFPQFFITMLIKGNCYAYSAEGILTKVFSWSTFVLNGVIPFTLLIHINYVIVKTVRNSRKMFTRNVGTEAVDRRQKTMKSAENQLTTMLLLITTLFLILLLPTYMRFIYASFVTSDTPSKFAYSLLIFEISWKLFATNSGINFFLYCVSGTKFRNDLKEIVCCKGKTTSSLVLSSTDTNRSISTIL